MAEHILLLTVGFVVPCSMAGSWWKLSDAVPHSPPHYLSASSKIDQILFCDNIWGRMSREQKQMLSHKDEPQESDMNLLYFIGKNK